MPTSALRSISLAPLFPDVRAEILHNGYIFLSLVREPNSPVLCVEILFLGFNSVQRSMSGENSCSTCVQCMHNCSPYTMRSFLVSFGVKGPAGELKSVLRLPYGTRITGVFA